MCIIYDIAHVYNWGYTYILWTLTYFEIVDICRDRRENSRIRDFNIYLFILYYILPSFFVFTWKCLDYKLANIACPQLSTKNYSISTPPPLKNTKIFQFGSQTGSPKRIDIYSKGACPASISKSLMLIETQSVS